MVTGIPFTPNPIAQHFSKLDEKIIELITQRALLKLTSNTAYLNVLNYCLNRMEQLHDIRIIVIDHITTQDNRGLKLTYGLTDSHDFDNLKQDDSRFKAQYFSCTSSQLEQACDLSSDNLNYLNKCLDHPLTRISNQDSILNKLFTKEWLKKRQFNQDMIEDSMRNTISDEQAKAYYRIDFVQLQHDLQTIGYDLMILKAPCNNDSSLHIRTTKVGAKQG